MLKINLLPPYIHQRKQVKVAIAVVTALVAAEVGLLIAASSGPRAEQQRLTTLQGETGNRLTALQAIGTKSGTEMAKEQALAPKHSFITGMLEYNKKYPDLYATTAAYTYREVMFLTLEAQQNVLQFEGYVSSPSHVSRLMLGLSNCNMFTGLPQVTGVPGYSAAQAAQRRAAAQMAESAPSTIIGGYQGMPGAPGFSGDMGGFGGGGNGPGMAMGGGPAMAMGGPGMNPYSSGGGFGGGGNGPGMGMGGGPAMMGPGGGMGGFGGGGNGPGMGAGDMGAMGGAMSGGGFGGGGGQGNFGGLPVGAARVQPKGFFVTVACSLAQPIIRPNYMTSDQQAGGGAGGGMMGGGMMGGGMMGGASGGMGPAGGSMMMGGNGPGGPGLPMGGP